MKCKDWLELRLTRTRLQAKSEEEGTVQDAHENHSTPINELRAAIERERADIPIELIRSDLHSISQLCIKHNGHQFELFP